MDIHRPVFQLWRTYPDRLRQLVFECPLQHEIMRDAYLAFTICQYDVNAFLAYIQSHGNAVPQTGLPLSPPGSEQRDPLSILHMLMAPNEMLADANATILYDDFNDKGNF